MQQLYLLPRKDVFNSAWAADPVLQKQVADED